MGWWVELEGRLIITRAGSGPVGTRGVLGRYGHCGNNQRPGADAADGTSRTRALAVSRSHRRGREWPTPSNKKIRCRHDGPVLLIGAASPTAKPATDPPTSRPTYPRDREVPLACLVGEPYARVRYQGLRCVVGVKRAAIRLRQQHDPVPALERAKKLHSVHRKGFFFLTPERF